MCIVVPAKRGQSQDTARQLYAMRKKMVVLPILARRTGTRYRESGGGRKRGEGMGKWGDIVGGGGGGGSWWEHRRSQTANCLVGRPWDWNCLVFEASVLCTSTARRSDKTNIGVKGFLKFTTPPFPRVVIPRNRSASAASVGRRLRQEEPERTCADEGVGGER